MQITKIILAGAFAATVAAQIPAGFPPCGEVCIQNMLNQAPQLGCTDQNKSNPKCLCKNQDFLFGVRDCAKQSCNNDTASAIVTQFGLDFCASNGEPVTLPSGTSAAGSGSSSASSIAAPVPTGVSVTTITSGGSSLVSTITAGASAVSSSASAAVSGASSSVNSLVTSVASSASGLASSVGSSASSLASAASSLSSAASSASASASRTGGVGPRQTAAPVGLLAVAGAAAFFL